MCETCTCRRAGVFSFAETLVCVWRKCNFQHIFPRVLNYLILVHVCILFDNICVGFPTQQEITDCTLASSLGFHCLW